MWNRYNYPTVNDADEGGDILILRNNGHKAVYNWEDFCDEKLLARDIGWMPLPPSDNVEDQPIRITIESGERKFRVVIAGGGNHIEVYDQSEDALENSPPIISEEVDGLDGVLRMVESILVDGFIEAPDDDCGCEGVLVNDTVLQGFIDAIRGSVPEPKPKPWQKKSPPPPPPPPPSSGTILIKEGENPIPESWPKPWQKNRGK